MGNDTEDSLTDQIAIVQAFNLVPASFKGYRLNFSKYSGAVDWKMLFYRRLVT